MMPKYPVYIPSKGRAESCLTADFLLDDGVLFRLVVEPQDQRAYAERYGQDKILVLPWDNPGSVIPARNWIKEHSTRSGHERHWQLDDNIKGIVRRKDEKLRRVSSAFALAQTELFVDRYSNVAIAGLAHRNFANFRPKPFYVNHQPYCCVLVLNDIPFKWRGPYFEDADFCLQVLSAKWCTILMNVYLIEKSASMAMRGGNTDTVYRGDGRLNMVRGLQRRWPGLVKIKRRWGRPQQNLASIWNKFDHPLIRKEKS